MKYLSQRRQDPARRLDPSSAGRRWTGRTIAIFGALLGVLNWFKEVDESLPVPFPHSPFVFLLAIVLVCIGLWLSGALAANDRI